MSQKNDSGKYWPYMILGFLTIGITLGYWTIKSTISSPIQESSIFLEKYQSAEKRAVEIEEAEERFNNKYSVELIGLEKSNFKPKNLKRKPHQYYKLDSKISYEYKITTKDGKAVDNAKIELLLTQPLTSKHDKKVKVENSGDGIYKVQNLEIPTKGRYILRTKISIGDSVKYLDIYGFKK